jgi:hypothetical protein
MTIASVFKRLLEGSVEVEDDIVKS